MNHLNCYEYAREIKGCSFGSFFSKMPSMQTILSKSKYVILAVVGCALIVTLNSGNNFNATDFNLSGLSASSVEDITSVAKPTTVWDNMSDNFSLDHEEQSSQVQVEIKSLLADQDKLHKILQDAAPYIYYIYQQTQARGLPAEIALIPFIESEFNPNNTSNKGALGLWQLMSGTAHELGIQAKSGYDGRRNVVDSTRAALAYFKDLGNDFNGNWYLAIAAYNCGQGKVESVERKTGSHDFWDLPLPKETKVYVPKLLAVAAIIKDPQKYGVQLPPVYNQPYFTQVKSDKSVNLASLSKETGANMQVLNKLNPDYKHGVIPKNGTYSVLVPVNNAQQVETITSTKA